MIRRAMVLGALMVVALAAAGCSDDGGTGGRDSTAASSGGGGSTETSVATDASLIPPSDATSPTSGPPNTDPLAGAGAPAASTCDEHGDASPSRVIDELELRVQLRETLETGRVRWSLTVDNKGDETATLVYATAQDGDVVLRQDGEVVYRWSDGSASTQAQRCQLIGAAQEYQFTLGGTDLDIAPGDYELTASLTSEPAPAPARIDVTVIDPDAN